MPARKAQNKLPPEGGMCLRAGGPGVDLQCHGQLQMFIKRSSEEVAISRDNFRETQKLEMRHPLCCHLDYGFLAAYRDQSQPSYFRDEFIQD